MLSFLKVIELRCANAQHTMRRKEQAFAKVPKANGAKGNPSKDNQQKIARSMEASTNLNLGYERDICVWRGWLHKLSRGILVRWQQRWFEVRREKMVKRADKAILKYFSRVDGKVEIVEKRLTVVDVQRVLGRCHSREACVSVIAEERHERILLSASSIEEAESLVSDILSILNSPKPTEGAPTRAVSKRSPSPNHQRAVSPGFAVKREEGLITAGEDTTARL